jgi:hypothetical protein
MKALIGLVVALSTAALLASPAHAGGRHHHHGHGARLSLGFHFGAPLYWHHPWPAYYYAPAPVYVTPSVVHMPQPPVYVERHETPTTDQQGWWYYCGSAKGYYPYVKECPGGWQKVPPAPQ